MSKKLLHKTCIIFVCIAFVVAGAAQSNFHYSAALGEVDKEAFYKIILPPTIVGRCRPGLVDIRIKDEKGNQVPYIAKSDAPTFNEKSFIEFPIISNGKEADKQTHVVIKNLSFKEISYLLLIVKNTEAKRLVTLSGSDDAKHWFVIKENMYLDNYFSDKGNFVQTISFPPSSYQYFQVTINGQNILPVNIQKAGIYKENFIDGKYIELPAPIIEQKDSADKYSYVKFVFNEPYRVDKIELDIRGPKFFSRSAELFSIDGSKIFGVIEINSGATASFPVSLRASAMTMVIDNEDNIPLKITGAKCWQLNQYLLAYFEGGKTYTLYFGDSTASAPKYDLELFKDSVGKNPAELTAGKIEAVSKPAQIIKKKNAVFNTVVLWLVISGVLILLVTLTFRMTKEVDKKGKNN